VKFSKKDLIKLYTNLVRARTFDMLCTRLLAEGKFVSFYHEGAWGDAAGVGTATFLRKDDILYPHHRAHGFPHMIGKGVDPKYYLAEHCGRATGCCSGVGTVHALFEEYGILGQSAILGAQFTVSVGWGLAAKKNGTGQVVVASFGDGTLARGTWHEGANVAVLWKLPIVYVLENNGIAQYVSLEKAYPLKDMASLAAGYGMPAVVVDGQDIVAVAEAVGEAVKRARQGKGPTFVECKTIRVTSHGYGSPHMVDGEQRDMNMVEELKKREPLSMYEKNLLKQGIITKEDIEEIAKAAKEEAAAAEKFAMESPIQEDASILDQYLYAE
jgi:pyruvate dehydrogenase E1 component alpha subunit